MAGPKEIEEKLRKAVNAFETLAPGKTFAGMTLDQFKAALAPSFATRDTIGQLDDQLTHAINQRDAADEVSLVKLQAVVAGVLADPTEGPDSSVYEAMGYTRKSERATGLTKKSSKTSGGTPPPAP
jgi:hypothetical protein